MIAIYGAGGFGREVAWLIGDKVACFIEEKAGGSVNNIPVRVLSDITSDLKVVCAVGSPAVREVLVKRVMFQGLDFDTVIHPNVEISRWVDIGTGVIICAGNIITTNIKIGNHVHINLDCTIGHDVVIKDYATLAPGVHVSGNVHIGKGVYIGTGANIINGTKDNPLVIGDHATVGAGACVIRNVSPGDTVVGVPAKVVR